MKKEDLRVKKTKLSLYNGLIELMGEKPFEAIKVSDICTKAMINRSTFYDHFNDKYELFEAYIENLGHTLEEKFNDNSNYDNYYEFYFEHLKLLLDEIDSKTEIYKTIINNNFNSITKDMLVEASIKSIMKHINTHLKNFDEYKIRLKILFYVSGAISIISENLRNNNKLSNDEYEQLFKELIPGLNIEK